MHVVPAEKALMTGRRLLVALVVGGFVLAACSSSGSSVAAPKRADGVLAVSVTKTAVVQREQVVPTRTRYVVSGRSVGLKCKGHGRMPVVFQAGGSAGGAIWTTGGIVPALGSNVFTCVFDRPGVAYGRTEAATSPPLLTPRAIEKILVDTLRQAHVGPRVILVGHSIGGLDSVVFGADYPTLVAGGVLLDPSSPAALTDPDDRGAFLHYGVNPDAADAEIRAIKRWPAVPLVVLTSDLKEGVAGGAYTAAQAGAWSLWHKHYARLSSKGVERQVAGAAHNDFTSTAAAGKDSVAAIRGVLRDAK
jgi:pimeloyl-ACP methyl ester carboxylesterase